MLQLVAIGQGRDDEVERITQEARELAISLPGQQDPELACILFGQSRMRLSQGKAPEAERLARESVAMHRRTRAKDHPELAWGLLELGRALAKQDKYSDAEKQLKEALAIFRKHYPNDRFYGPKLVIGELASVLRAQNKRSEADALQQEPARRLLEPLEKHPRDINSWLTIGETLQSAKIWEMALLAYREAAKLTANADRASRVRLGHDFRAVGRGLQKQRRYAECELPYREAGRWLEQAIAESSGADDLNDLTDHLASVYAYRGWALKQLNQPEEAVDAERKAIALWKRLGQAVPEGDRHEWYAHEEAHFSLLLAEVLESMGRSKDALEYARAAVRLHEELLGRRRDSKEHLEVRGPADEPAAGRLGSPRDTKESRVRLAGSQEILLRVLLSLRRADEAIALQRRVCELNPGNPACLRRLALTEAKFGRFDEAIADFSKVIELSPDSALDHRHFAWLLATSPDAKVRNPQRAIELAKKTVELAPKEGKNWNTLGVAYYRSGDWKGAIAALEKSMELRKSGDAFDWFFVAMAHWKLDHQKEAREWYEKAVAWMEKNQPKDEELRRFRAEAEELLGMKK